MALTHVWLIEEYKRPKFEVSFPPIESSYKLNTDVKLIGNAVAYAGNQIDGATVKYRVVRSANFPYWCWYRWGYTPNSETREITSGETTTNESGEFDLYIEKELKAIDLEIKHINCNKNIVFFYNPMIICILH